MWPFTKRTKPVLTEAPIQPPLQKSEQRNDVPKTYGEKMVDKERGKWIVRVYYWVKNPEIMPNGGQYKYEEATGAETYVENAITEADKMYHSLMVKHGGTI